MHFKHPLANLEKKVLFTVTAKLIIESDMKQSTLMCDTEQVFMSTLQMIQKLNLFQQTVLRSKTLQPSHR